MKAKNSKNESSLSDCGINEFMEPFRLGSQQLYLYIHICICTYRQCVFGVSVASARTRLVCTLDLRCVCLSRRKPHERACRCWPLMMTVFVATPKCANDGHQCECEHFAYSHVHLYIYICVCCKYVCS